MRYVQLASFENHLSQSEPDHLCTEYLVFLADPFERRQIMEHTYRLFPPQLERFSFRGGEKNFEKLKEEVQNFSLFVQERLFVIDELEVFSEKEKKELVSFLQQKDPKTRWILGAKSAQPLFSFMEGDGVILDLSKEKPWEREKRLVYQAQNYAKGQGKRVSIDALSLLFEYVGYDLAKLQQELLKLFCYTEEKKSVEKQDVIDCIKPDKTQNLWKWAEGVVWEKERDSMPDTLHALLPLIRSQLILGRKIACLLESKVAELEWGEYLPRIWPKVLEKRKGQVKLFTERYFEKGLKVLFEVEKLLREGSHHEEALLDWFQTELHRK